MTVDNLNQILNLLNFDSDDDFYSVQLIRRRKENPQLKTNARVIRTYRIESKDQLLDKYDEIKALCHFFNARACINLNRRSFKKLAFKTLEKVTNQILAEDYKNVSNAYDSVTGSYSNEPLSRWVVDIDTDDFEFVERVVELINRDCLPSGYKTLDIVKTVNGYHIISHPFNTQQFNKLCEDQFNQTFDLHKDNPTILYYRKPQ